MKTKTIALIIAFSAVAIVLNPAFRLTFPVFYMPTSGLFYQFFEIPIVAALLLLGFRSGVAVGVLNSTAMVFLYPGNYFLYAAGNLLAVTSMMVGMYLSIRLYESRAGSNSDFKRTKVVLFSTAFGILFRVLAMTPFWYGVVQVFYPDPSHTFMIVLPLQAIFNSTLPLYTIPIAFLIARTINKNLKIGT